MQQRRITIKARRFWQHERLVKRLEAFEGRQIADGIWECRLDERGRRDLEGLYGPVLHIELYPKQSTP